MKGLLIAAFVLFTLPALPQLGGQARLDSLLGALAGSDRDTTRVNLLQKTAFAYRGLDPAAGMRHAEDALELAQELNWTKGVINSHINIAVIHSNLGNYSKSLEVLDKALAIQKANPDAAGPGSILVNKALNYYHMNEYARALEANFQALKIFEERNCGPCLAKAHGNIGLIYADMGEFEYAIKYHSLSLDHHEKVGNKDGQGRALGNIGIVYMKMKEYDKALEHDLIALRIYKELGQKRGAAINMINAGSVYLELNDLTNAYRFMSDAHKLFQELGDRNAEAICRSNLGDLLLRSTKVENAPNSSAPFDRPARDRLLQARAHLTGAIQTLQEIKDHDAGKDALLNLSQVEEALGNTGAALAHYRASIAMRDSIFSTDTRVELAKLETKREKELKEKDLEIQGLRLQKAEAQRAYLVAGSVMLMVLLGLLYNRSRLKQRRNMLLVTMQEELRQKEKTLFAKQVLEMEMKALRAQMDPHFIFNCLNAIQAMILDEKKQVATEYLQKFSRLIRLILDNSRKDSTTLEDEAEILTLYLDLEKLRMSNGFEYEISIPDDVEPAFTEFPSMVIQPLVENSIWHGLMPAQRQGHLRISFRRDHDHLTCVVEDNGIGRDLSRRMKNTEAHDPKGLKLIQERLQAWSRTRDTECNVFVQNVNEDGSGTRTEISIQYPAVVQKREVAAVA